MPTSFPKTNARQIQDIDVSETPPTDGQVLKYVDLAKEYQPSTGGGGTDPDAIHDNVSGEIAAIAGKTALVDNDIALIEDSQSTNSKKSVTMDDLKDYAISDFPSIIEDGGAKEINVDGLSGELADPQKQKVQPFGGDDLYTTSTGWVTFYRFVFRGTTEMGTPTNIKLLMAESGFGSPATANVRVVDAENGDAVICSRNGVSPSTHPTFSREDLGSLSNLPSGEHIFEVQVQKATGGGAKEIHLSGGVIEW